MANVRQAALKSLRVLPLSHRRRLIYLRWQRRPLRLRDPQLFTEKVNWRIVHDRRPLLADTCDKLAMKDMAAASGAAVKIPRTLWFGTDLTELADIDLPAHWVLKPNHRSGEIHFGTASADIGELQRSTAGWMDDMQTAWFGEWGYGQARRLLLVEERIGEPETPPEDYKFFCFDGQVEVVQIDWDRFGQHTRRFYDPDWTPLPNRNTYRLAPVTPVPAHLAEMIEVAAAVSAPYDFMRVDLYDDEDGVFFGEITPYPGSGIERFEPVDLDVRLGRCWRLPTLRPASIWDDG